MKHKSVAPTPPMGWNSWDCYGASVTEDEIKGNADYIAKNLKQYGWEYVVVDIQWYEPTANSSHYHPFTSLTMDQYSRLMPSENRFPSARNGQGFKPLGDYIHDLGLKFGLHMMRGIPRQAVHNQTSILGTEATAKDIAHPNSICPWNTDMYGVDVTKEGAQQYYNSLFQLYASWGVDFVKVDDIAASRLYDTHLDEIELIRNAIDQCGRQMVLSLSPGPAPLEYAEHFKANANMWRMTDDFWDQWSLLYQMFERCEKWEKHVEPGLWPDCDMLPLGHLGIRSVDGPGGDRWTRFTKDEQLTMMTLWSIFRSPLMFGGELRDNNEWTLSLLTNEEVLAVNQTSHSNRLLYRRGNKIVWTARGLHDETYLAFFNLSDEPEIIDAALSHLGLFCQKQARDLWEKEDLGLVVQDNVGFLLPPHGSKLIKIN
ncbi:glycoside hydrolase family 27 protein [Anaerobacillus alkaliphilus]|uniref:Alpha-galactosidase n=1 Tax=Anaerobacillus alkaliphilus TaxID=1548597 RepID=A0A4Q0VMS3_9BACI|nr:glycoside hydrolase family 27 protein [Anaerobacillus alkaliphilus]RXI96256.1 glycoside hydrolase family 27 protein [Anaerobacillus alkaliphilus]